LKLDVLIGRKTFSSINQIHQFLLS
jgi:hypothetical protein